MKGRVPLILSLTNLSEVLCKRWFKYLKYDVLYYSTDVSHVSSHAGKSRLAAVNANKLYSQSLSIHDVCVGHVHETVRLYYQLREAGNCTQGYSFDCGIGKRAKVEESLACERSTKPVHFREEDEVSGINVPYADEQENTNNLSIFNRYDNTIYTNVSNPLILMDNEKSNNLNASYDLNTDTFKGFFTSNNNNNTNNKIMSNTKNQSDNQKSNRTLLQNSNKGSDISFEQQVQMIREKIDLAKLPSTDSKPAV